MFNARVRLQSHVAQLDFTQLRFETIARRPSIHARPEVLPTCYKLRPTLRSFKHSLPSTITIFLPSPILLLYTFWLSCVRFYGLKVCRFVLNPLDHTLTLLHQQIATLDSNAGACSILCLYASTKTLPILQLRFVRQGSM
jgi:hypothetical protein